ncbi:NmrA family transcriptional regulator [Streptomyces sp. WMMB303]|uniref:SDR family oxidoreductase n=1 Tax=Streptomyces sp. WMMB303 TaxID=3034154 RepID=UPI003207AE91
MTQQKSENAAERQHARDRVLVLCGTGKNGARVVERLRARGCPVRVGSRTGQPPFDWEDPGTWDAALAGVGAVFVVCQPDVGAPGVADAVRGFGARAAAAGVRRLVLLSARGEESALPTEQAVRDAGTEWTILRTSWFFQNFSEGVFLPSVLAGELPFPAGEVREPFIDADDIAEVAAAVLTEEGHHARVHELTGPRLLTFGDAVAEVTAAGGPAVRYVPVATTGVRRRADPAGAAAGAGGLPGRTVRTGAGRPERLRHGRRAGGAGPPGSGRPRRRPRGRAAGGVAELRAHPGALRVRAGQHRGEAAPARERCQAAARLGRRPADGSAAPASGPVASRAVRGTMDAWTM